VTRFAHTNLVARDWKALAAFYADVIGCEPLPPERESRSSATTLRRTVRSP
jgi:catechol-2,3-dioxygenase